MSVAFAFILAAATTGAGYAGPLVLLGVVLTMQALMVARWHRAVGAPGAMGGAPLAFAVGAAALALLWAEVGPSPLVPLTGLLGAAAVAVLLHQLVRRTRTRVVASMTATATLVVFTVLAALYLPAREEAQGPETIALVTFAAVAAHAVSLVRLRKPVAAVSALAAGAVAGAAGGAASGLGVGAAALVGLTTGAVAHAAAAQLSDSGDAPPWLVATLPICLAAPVAYLASRLMGA